jgi:hypothetical protein
MRQGGRVWSVFAKARSVNTHPRCIEIEAVEPRRHLGCPLREWKQADRNYSLTTCLETTPGLREDAPDFRTGEGKHFVVSSDEKWRHKPSAGLHVPGLSHEHVEKFLDLMEQGSALREEMSENDRKIAEAEDAIRKHGWNPFGSKAHLKSLKDKLAELERDGVALQREWAKLEAEYKQAGFHEHEVTGYRSGANAEYQQDSTGGKGFKNAVRAYRKSQEEDLRGGQGVEPTYDEMAIISAPADAIAAFRLGAAALRMGYQVARQGGGYILRRQTGRLSKALLASKEAYPGSLNRTFTGSSTN